jgi:hypothetical protein
MHPSAGVAAPFGVSSVARELRTLGRLRELYAALQEVGAAQSARASGLLLSSLPSA